MRRVVILAVACVLALAGRPMAQSDALKTAADALGAANIKTIGFAGSGKNFSLGQNFTSTDPWPAVPVTTYTALINFDTASMRTEILREMGQTMPRGGGAPFFGQQRQNQNVSGNFAWNVPVPNPPPAGAAPAAPAGGGGGGQGGGQAAGRGGAGGGGGAPAAGGGGQGGGAPQAAAPAGPPPAPAPGNAVER